MLERFVVFSLNGGRYALGLDVVERVVPALELTPLPNAPAIVLGAFNLEGRIIPVMNLRRRFELPERPIQVSDHFLVAHARTRTVALVVDDTMGLVERPTADITATTAFLPELPYVRGVIRLPEGIVLIHDLARFLSAEESAALEAVVAADAPP